MSKNNSKNLEIAYQNIHWYLLLLSVFFILKLWHSHVSIDELRYFVFPAKLIVSLITGSEAQFISGQGYFYANLNILIDKSCSGFNFFLLCYMMLGFLFLRYASDRWQCIRAMILLPFVSILLTIFANSSRIWTVIIIGRTSDRLGPGAGIDLHQATGVLVYLFFLIAMYGVADLVLRNRGIRYA